MNWSFFGFQSYEVWIMVIGAIACSAAGVIGSFLVLRKLSLMGDAISHSVLPGIAIGAMISGKVSSLPVLIGAGAVGVATPYLIDSLRASRRIYEDAAIGAVFTVLFSIGVILVVNMGNVHLDVDCVLQGEIAMAPLDTWRTAAGTNLGPRSVWILGTVLLLDLAFVTLCYKELKISTFDPALAAAMGLRPRLLHYMLLGLVAVTTIAAFESVGAIIVVAMLIAPGATAYLLTDRLWLLLVLSGLVGIACSVLGYLLSLSLGGKGSVAGCMATVAGLLFAAAFLLSPRYGILPRAWRRLRLARRLAREHILLTLYRAREHGQERLSIADFASIRFGTHPPRGGIAQLSRRGLLRREGGDLVLTEAGATEAAQLLRGHRLWEAFLESELGLPPDHVHRSADDMEHFLSPELQERLAHALEHPEEDPHGRPIPSGADE